MKKALQITLAGSLFTIEEDAYEQLGLYLDSIKAYFATLADGKDVTDDIEARISEQLLEKVSSRNNIVTIGDVNNVIATMGSVEEITGDESHASSSQSEPVTHRKLYRDGDDSIIAGVSSGLAAYLGCDPLIIRIAVIALTLVSSGGFIFAYIALALLVPKAETSADKIRMRGGPATLASFKETLEEQIENVRTNGANLVAKNSSARTGIEKLLRMFGSLIRVAGKVIVKATALLLVIVPIIVCVAIVFAAANLFFNINPGILGDVGTMIPAGIFYALSALILLVAFIPNVLLASLGISMLSSKWRMSGKVVLILSGIWLVAAIFAGTLGLRTVFDIERNTDSQYLHSQENI